MKPSKTCSNCKKVNYDLWVIAKLDGHTTKLCKPCATEVTRNPADNSNRFEANKRRIERERKEKNKEIIRQLKSNTYPSTPGSR